MHLALSGHFLAQNRLKRLFDEEGLPWADEPARKMLKLAAKKIAESLEARGQTEHYSLETQQRRDSVQKHLEKRVRRMAEQSNDVAPAGDTSATESR